MKYSVIPTPAFEKELKPLLKRHRSLVKDLVQLEKQLELRPTAGTGLGNGMYKVRLPKLARAFSARACFEMRDPEELGT